MDVRDPMDEMTPDRIIDLLGMVPLQPEGGHVRQTWLDERSSAIYYLVVAPDFSGLHRLEHLEIWAWHAGAPARMLLIDETTVEVDFDPTGGDSGGPVVAPTSNSSTRIALGTHVHSDTDGTPGAHGWYSPIDIGEYLYRSMNGMGYLPCVTAGC